MSLEDCSLALLKGDEKLRIKKKSTCGKSSLKTNLEKNSDFCPQENKKGHILSM